MGAACRAASSTAAGSCPAARLILVDGPSVAGVQSYADAFRPPDCELIEAAGTVLLPALIDTHVHLVR